MQTTLIILAIAVLIVFMIAVDKSEKLQKKLKFDEEYLIKKYADEIKQGSIQIEPIPSSVVYKKIIIIIFTTFFIIVINRILLPYLLKISQSCELIAGIDPLYWYSGVSLLFLGIMLPIASIILPMFKIYKKLSVECFTIKEMNLRFYVWKKISKTRAKLNSILLFISVVVMPIFVLIFVGYLTTVVTYKVVQQDSVKKQQKCLKAINTQK